MATMMQTGFLQTSLRCWPRAATALALCLGLAACGKPGGAGGVEPGDRVVARVGGDVVYASDVKRQALAEGVINEGDTLDPASSQFHATLDEVIDQKLLAREAVRLRLDKDPKTARRLLAAQEKVLGDVLIEGRVKTVVNETSIRTLYAEQQRVAKGGEEIRARQIVCAAEADAQAVKKLLSTGASFETLAMQKSTDQETRFNGGDLGYFTLDSMPAPYGDALKAAKPGAIVGPFKTDAGYVIARIEDRRPEQPITLEEARPQIVRFLTYDEIKTLLAKLRAATQVEVTLPPSPPPQPPSKALDLTKPDPKGKV